MTDSILNCTPVVIFFGFLWVLTHGSKEPRQPMQKIPPLDQMERNYCDCGKCKAGCKAMPGMLAPGDLKAIARHMKVPDTDDHWLVNNFVASEGAKVKLGPTVRNIPTITPRQESDGRCVFLDDDDRCSIHKVSPFGCRTFRICNEPDVTPAELIDKAAEDTEKISAALKHCIIDDSYNESWEILHNSGCIAEPLTVRRGLLTTMLRELEEPHE